MKCLGDAMETIVRSKLFVLIYLMCLSFCEVWGQKDIITADVLGAKPDGYSILKEIIMPSKVGYLGSCMKSNSGEIQMRPEYKNDAYSGVVVTDSKRLIKSIQIQWSSGVPNGGVVVYGKNYQYNKSHFTENGKGWGSSLGVIADDDVHDLSQTGYNYIGIRSASHTVYIKSIAIEWQKMKRNLHFSQDVYYADVDTEFPTPKLEGGLSGDKLCYESSNPKVATVDARTGTVNIVGDGSTIITVSAEETLDYRREQAQYTLCVRNRVKYEFYECEIGNLPENYSMVLGDAELLVKAGDETSKFQKGNNGYVGLRLAVGAQLEVRVPSGLNIDSVNLAFATLNGKGGAQLFQKGNPSIYKVVKAIQAASLTAFYTGVYKINIGESKHATFSANRAYVMPKGVQGGIVKIDNERRVATVDYCVQPGEVVAARQALLLKGNPGMYDLVPTKEVGKSFDAAENNLCPVLTCLPVKAPEDSQFYILALSDDGKLGFYWQSGSNEGDGVADIANKAYLKLPKGSGAAVQGYRLDWGESTGVEKMEVIPLPQATPIYTLAGVPVNQSVKRLPKGVYIMNGSKVFIK